MGRATATFLRRTMARMASYPYSAFYSGRLWDPYWGYLYPTGYFSYNDGKGEVRLAAPKQSDVYLDNAYAGKAEKLKSIWLKPGAYDLSVSNQDHASFISAFTY